MKKIIYSTLAILATVVIPSCKSLDVPPPNNLTDEQIQEILKGTDESAKDIIISGMGLNLQNNFNMVGGTWTGYSSYSLNSQVDQDFLMSMRGNDAIPGTIETANSGHETAYQLVTTYKLDNNTFPYYALCATMVANANKVIYYMTPEGADLGGKVAKFRGQALTLRAYGYLQLMERFRPAEGKEGKGMPLYKEYKVNPPAKISSAAETYDMIIEDLKEAVVRLQEYGYTTDPFDIDLGVAQFLLARAALWAKDYDTCIEAGKALTSKYKEFIKEEFYGGKDADLDNYVNGSKDIKAENSAFLSVKPAVNPEVILGFPDTNGSNTYFYSFFNVFGGPSLAGNYQEAPRIDDRLFDKMDEKDFRKAIFTSKRVSYTYIIDNQNTKEVREIPPYATLKWAATICKDSNKRDHKENCDNVIFRTSEAYLMLAEAYAMKNDAANAKKTLDVLLTARTKKGETPLTCDSYNGMGGMSAIQMVQLQTRIEMWMEGGREFYNNKRWGIQVDRSGSKNHYRTGNKLSLADMVLDMAKEETSPNTNWSE